jgi:hypothetical protein
MYNPLVTRPSHKSLLRLVSMSLLLLAQLVAPAPRAYADAVVTVQLKSPQGQPASGKVTLLGSDGKPVASCNAQAGRCEMHGVAGGMYTVTVEPTQGAAPKPHKVMIPASGNVSLLVSTG